MNFDPIRLGTLLPTRELAITGSHDPQLVIDLARHLDTQGTDSLWIGESVTARPRLDTYAMLGAVAAVTARSTLGTAVLLPSLRNPVDFAHRVATLDRLAGGRLVLGVGAGFPGDATRAEFTTLGSDPRTRVTGIEATIEAARAIWTGATDGRTVTDPTGRFGFDDVSITPPPTTPGGPRTWLATATASGLERCGRHHDGWLPYPTHPDHYRSGLAAVRASAERAGRDPSTITPGLYVTVAIGEGTNATDDAQRSLEQYATAYYGAPSNLVGLVQAMIAGSLDDVVERVGGTSRRAPATS